MPHWNLSTRAGLVGGGFPNKYKRNINPFCHLGQTWINLVFVEKLENSPMALLSGELHGPVASIIPAENRQAVLRIKMIVL